MSTRDKELNTKIDISNSYIEARRRGILYFDNAPEITIQDIRMFFKGSKD